MLTLEAPGDSPAHLGVRRRFGRASPARRRSLGGSYELACLCLGSKLGRLAKDTASERMKEPSVIIANGVTLKDRLERPGPGRTNHLDREHPSSLIEVDEGAGVDLLRPRNLAVGQRDVESIGGLIVVVGKAHEDTSSSAGHAAVIT